jgi:hypothetical protein
MPEQRAKLGDHEPDAGERAIAAFRHGLIHVAAQAGFGSTTHGVTLTG